MDRILLLIIFFGLLFLFVSLTPAKPPDVLSSKIKPSSYWLLLQRKSNIEYLFIGNPGNAKESRLLKTFKVKTGIPGLTPTPLPQLFGRKYWLIVDKQKEEENPETSPYFLTLNIPVSDKEPFGPTPYLECDGQCNWNIPGYFGLHGTASNAAKLRDEDPGSSGCIRHSNEDITFLFNLLHPRKEEVRYYIEDI